MYSFIKDLNEYSVGKEEQKAIFEFHVYEKKLEYLKSVKYLDLHKLQNPLEFQHLKLDESKLEDAIDVSSAYSLNLEDEKEVVKKRALNLNYLRSLNNVFEGCRSTCKVPDSRFRNINLMPKDNQTCMTDCLNVVTENREMKKPNNDTKVFVWLH